MVRTPSITVQRPDLSDASDRARHLVELRYCWSLLAQQAEEARRVAHEYEHGVANRDRQPGEPYADYSPSGGTPLTYEERAMAQRLYAERISA